MDEMQIQELLRQQQTPQPSPKPTYFSRMLDGFKKMKNVHDEIYPVADTFTRPNQIQQRRY